MTLIIAVQCKDGVVLGGDGKVVFFEQDFSSQAENYSGALPYDKFYPLPKYRKIMGFAFNTQFPISYCVNAFNELEPDILRQISTVQTSALNQKISNIMEEMKAIISKAEDEIRELQDNYQKLNTEFILAEATDFVTNLSSYRITASHVIPLTPDMDGLYQIGISDTFSTIKSFFRQQNITIANTLCRNMIPLVHNALDTAINEHKKQLGYPINIYQLNTDGLKLIKNEDVPVRIPPNQNKLLDDIKEINRRLKSLPMDLYSHYAKALLLVELGRYAEAITAYEQILRIDPKSAKALYNKGIALEKLGEYQGAIKCYDKALRIDPGDVATLVNKGIVSVKLGKTLEGIECYNKALQIDKNDVKALYNKGVALGNLGKHQEAIMCFDGAVQINPNLKEALCNKGVALGKLGMFDKESAAYDEALTIDPKDTMALYNKGVALGNLGKHQQAITCFDAALQINSNLKEALYNKGVALTFCGKYQEALCAFRQILNEKEAKTLIAELKKKIDSRRN